MPKNAIADALAAQELCNETFVQQPAGQISWFHKGVRAKVEKVVTRQRWR